jgi:Short C-terminal domain
MAVFNHDRSKWLACSGQVLAEHRTHKKMALRDAPPRDCLFHLDVRVQPPSRATFDGRISIWMPIAHVDDSLVGRPVNLVVHPTKDELDAAANPFGPQLGSLATGASAQDIAAMLLGDLSGSMVNDAATPPPASPTADQAMFDALERLGHLRTAGILTEEEFAAQKARLLGTTP